MQMEPYVYKARCTRVIDGDTVNLEVDLGFHVFIKQRFRLSRIDAPETYGVKKDSDEQAAGTLAKERLTELILDKDVVIKTDRDRGDKYGRYLVEVIVDGTNVNDLLLEEGLVKVYS